MEKFDINEARATLNLSSTRMAKLMGVSYNTFKCWQNGSNRVTPATQRCVEILISIQGSKVGDKIIKRYLD